MKIETKYGLGEIVYVVYRNHNGIEVELDTITEICISKNKTIYFTENSGDDISESQIYPLEDFDKIKFELIKESDD